LQVREVALGTRDWISTNINIIVNPYRDIEGLYTKEMMDSYVGYRLGKLSPHIYAIAEEAFRSMQTQGNSQSILVSGESGKYISLVCTKSL